MTTTRSRRRRAPLLLLAAVAGGATLTAPVAAEGATLRSSFQLVQLTPSRIWTETSWVPFALADPPDRVFRYRLGANTFVGPWTPASVSVLTTTAALERMNRRYASASDALLADRALTAAERARLTPLAELYRDADVLVVAARHPACAGLTRSQARAIADGRITRWSQVVAGAPTDAIRVTHLVDGAGAAVPHMGTRWVGRLNRWRVTYAPGATGAPDGGVSRAAAGDASVAAVTTWSRTRLAPAGVCVVPLDGVAPSDATVRSLGYPEAFPVTYVVTRRIAARSALGRAAVVVQRRAMRAFLNSPELKDTLAKRGLLTG